MDAIHPGRVRFLHPIAVRADVAPSCTAELLLRLQTPAGLASRPMLRDLSQVTLINRAGPRTSVTVGQGARIIRDTATALLTGTAAHLAPEHTEGGEIGPSYSIYNVYTVGLMPPGVPTGLPASPGAPLEQALGRVQTTTGDPAQRHDPAHVTTHQHHVPDCGPQENTIPAVALSLSPSPPAAAASSARPPSLRPLSKAAAATLFACVVAGVLQSASVALAPARQIHTLVAR